MNIKKHLSTTICKCLTAVIALMGYVGANSQDLAHVSYYEAAEQGYLRNPMETTSGVVATNNRFNEIYLIKDNKISTIFSGANCGLYTHLSKDKKTIGLKVFDADLRQAPALLDVATGKLTVLEDYVHQCGQVSFADDGTMAYTMGNELIVRNGAMRKAYNLGVYVNIANISPDASRVAYSTITGDSYIVDLASGNIEKITVAGFDAYNPVWSPDGSKIAFEKVNGTLTVYERATRKSYQIGEAASVKWTDDSQNLVFTRAERENELIVNSASVIRSSFNGMTQTSLIAARVDCPTDVALTADGSLLVTYAGGTRSLNKVAVKSFGGAMAKAGSEVSLVTLTKGKRIGRVDGPDYNVVRKVIPTEAQTANGKLKEGSIGALDIPYVNQVWDVPTVGGNYCYGYYSCAPSSSCMLLGYYGLLDKKAVTSRASGVGTVYYSYYVGAGYDSPKTGHSFRNTLNVSVNGCGTTYGVSGGYAYMWTGGTPNSEMPSFYTYNGMKSASINSSWSKFCSESSANRPYTFCLQNGTGGHVVLGFRTNCYVQSGTTNFVSKTGSFVCHDPYGDYNGASYPNWDGRYSSYDWPGYSNGHKNIGVFYWGCVAIPPDGTSTTPSQPTITVSPASLNFECYQNEHPTLSFKVTGKDLTSNITVGSITPGRFTPDVSSLGTTGGTVKVTFNNSDKIGTYGSGGTAYDYNFYIKLTSGSLTKTVPITATVKAPPLNLTEKWNFSEQRNTKTQKGWDASKVRNFCYNDGKLYCVYDHTNIKVINAQTGEDLGNLNENSIVGAGTLKYCDVKCIDGHIVACNLATSNNSNDLRIYAWDSDSAEPYLVLSTTDFQGMTRMGDCMELGGSWSDLRVAFCVDQNSQTKIIEYRRNSSGAWSTVSTLVTTDGSTQLATGTTSRAYPKSSGWWVDGKSCYPAWCTGTAGGTATRQCQVNTGETWGASHHEFNWLGVKYAANLKFNDHTSNNDTYMGGRMKIIIDNTGNFSSTTNVGEFPSDGLGKVTKNINVTGDCMINTDGSTYVEAWVCSTSQGMAYFAHGSVPTHSVSPIKPAEPEPTPTTPSISASASSLSLSTVAGTPTTKTVKISGANLAGAINLALSGANADLFSLSSTSIAQSAGSADITVTYSPTAAGSHSATLTATSANATAVTVSLTGTATAQTPVVSFDDNITEMTEVWNFSGNASLGSWLDISGTGDYLRTIAFKDGKIYALHCKTGGTPAIKIIDAYTGAQTGSLSVNGIQNALFKLSGIAVIGGKIVASSISSANTNFYIYIWDNDSSDPRVLVTDSTHDGEVVGAQLSVSGDLNNGRLWINNDGTTKLLYYTVTNGTASQTPTVINLTKNGAAFAGGNGRGSAEVIYNSDGTIWLAPKDAVPSLFDASGAYKSSVNSGVVSGNQYGTAMKVIPFGEKKYLAATAYKSGTNNGGFTLTNVTAGVESASSNLFFYPQAGLGATSNDQRITSLCYATRNDGHVLDIWVSAAKQGVAYYTYNGEGQSAVEAISAGAMRIGYNGREVSVAGADVARISVYSTSGAMVADVRGENTLNVSLLARGMYIVRALDREGNVATRKIMR